MKFETFVALRYLRARRKQTIVSVISVISIIGIAAGVMALIIALALSTGFKEDIQAKILGTTSAINLLRIDGTYIPEYEEVMKRVGDVPHVTGSAPAIFNPVFISSSGRNQGAALKGVNPAWESTISDFFLRVTQANPDALESSAPASVDGIMIGKEMARSLGVSAGDVLDVFYPMGRLTPLGMSASKTGVVAVFESGLWDIDSNWAYVNIDAARRLFSFPAGSASVIQFRTDDLENVEEIAEDIRLKAGSDFITTTWIEQNKPLFSALKLEKLVLFLTIGLIVFVASLNIVTTLIMMVLEKQGDIAILAAMGATAKTIQRCLCLGRIIGIMGTALGNMLDWNQLILDAYKVIRLEAESVQHSYVPFHVRIWMQSWVCPAILISYLATIYLPEARQNSTR